MRRVKNYKNILIMMGLMLPCLFTIQGSYAAPCPGVGTVSIPSSVDINPSIAVGAILYSTTLYWGDTDLGCRYSGQTEVFRFNGVGVPNGNIYPTGIPGVGYRGHINGWPSGFEEYWPLEKNWITDNPSTPIIMAAGSLVFELVKMGPIQPGVFPAQTIMTSTIGAVPFFDVRTANSLTVKPNIPACTVTQSAITVNLDDANTAQLSALGNTSKDKIFNIPLNCPSAANISLAFSGDIADNANAVFRNLSGSANANSVGVQILKDNTPVPTTSGSYINLGLTNGSITVPLTARYYALTDNIDVGAVNAIAYATILYN